MWPSRFDPGLWRRHLFAGIASLSGAGVAVEYEGIWEPFQVIGTTDWGWDNGFDREPWNAMNVEFARRGVDFNPMYRPYLEARERGREPCLTRAELVPDREWYRSAYYREYHRPSGADATLYCILGLPGNGLLSALVLVRPGDEPNLPVRARLLIQELHARLAPSLGDP